MAEGGSDSPNAIDEETKKIRKTQEEKFRGRLSENDVKCLLQLNDGDPEAAFKDFCESDIKDLREKICGGDLDKVVSLKKDAVLRALEEKADTVHPIGKVRRQYACSDCDRVWWYWTPARKPVSRCRICRVKYDAIPVYNMFGWAIFVCECGNEFSGFGQMGVTSSQCYINRGGCGRMVLPTRVNPPDNRHRRKSRAQHSCNAPDCFNCMAAGPYRGGRSGTGPYRADRPGGSTGKIDVSNGDPKCVHPKSREQSSYKKRVLFGSTKHISTGSTVATYMTQDDQISVTSSYIANLQSIDEDDESVVMD